ncbi:hypothetical protein VTK26DRAFT_4385 [Humicola hyalothermophila]
MHLSLSTNGLLVLGLLSSISSAVPAPQLDIGNPPILTLPGGLPPTCVGFQDGVIKTPDCYTATTTVDPTKCPITHCPTPTGLILCPQYIKLTTISVPCSTDCCPTTPTHTVTDKCPGCPGTTCVIPTSTITVTTGCKTPVPPALTPTATLTFVNLD